MDIRLWLEKIRTRFWIIPTVIIIFEVILLYVCLHIPNLKTENTFLNFIFTSYSINGSRLILSATATALMTVIGVLFSLTIVILQQVSNQYSPRVIENFIKSFSSQLILGFFTGTFLYCLLALRQIPESSELSITHIPQATISVAVILAILCIALLIHYVDHISHSIQSSSIISSLKTETLEYWQNYDNFLNEKAVKNHQDWKPHLTWQAQIFCVSSGYFQAFSPHDLVTSLNKNDWRGVLQYRPGDYVHKGDLLMDIHTSHQLKPEYIEELQKAFTFGNTRTHTQDPRFGLMKLVDIALRAMSTGINDPETTVESLNAIGEVLSLSCTSCTLPEKLQISKNGVLEIKPLKFAEILEIAISPIFMAAENHISILKKLREILRRCTHLAKHKETRESCQKFEKKITLDLHYKIAKNRPLFLDISSSQRNHTVYERRTDDNDSYNRI